MRINSKVLGVAVVALAGLWFNGTANAAAVSSSVEVKTVTPVTVAETAKLKFGTFATGTSQSVIRVSQAGVRTIVSGDVALVTGVGADVEQAGLFTVTGDANRVVTVNIPQSSINITGPGTTMSLGSFSYPTTRTIGGGGTVTLNVGGDLTVNANQASGDYSGNYTVQVNYQ